jgi:predicted ATPase
VVAERIHRLPQSTQHLLSIASVEGDRFTAEVVAGVQAASERETLQCLSETLDRRHRLVSAEGIRRLGDQRLSRYRFRHILFQRYLYSNLDPVERAYLHERVGIVLEGLYHTHEIVAIAVQLARHFEEARITEKAIYYLHQAGERAVQMSAYEEGIAHLTKGLALLVGRPDGGAEGQRQTPEQRREHAEQELAFQLALGIGWVGAKGCVPEVLATYTRARELCEQLEKVSELGRVVGELSLFHYVRAEHQTARQLAEEALSLAQRDGDPLLIALERSYLAFILFCLGEYTLARSHLGPVIDFYEPEQHHRSLVSLRGSDTAISALAYDACCLWCLGYPDQATERSQEALALAREMGHPFSLVDILCYGGCLFASMRRDANAVLAHAEEMLELASEKVTGWLGLATRFRGEALAMLGHYEDGMAQMREGLTLQQSGYERCYQSGTFAALAKAQAKTGSPQEGLVTLAEALTWVEQSNERLWEPELHRLRGELLFTQGDKAEAEASLHKAIEVARRQQAKSWELRAATSLSRLWHSQGKDTQARALLADLYAWFTEGFDTADLQQARELLEELS